MVNDREEEKYHAKLAKPAKPYHRENKWGKKVKASKTRRNLLEKKR